MSPLNNTLQEPLTAEEKKFYGSIFKTLDPKGTGMISGGVAKPLLEASGLSLPTLGEIWNLSDSENSGFLNQFSFCVAMRLIAHSQKGDPITLSSANMAAPLAKFRTIQVNNTGSGILNSTISNPIPVPQPRITSSNSVQSFTSLNSASSNPSLVVPVLSQIQASNFGAMFDKTAVNGILPGAQAKNIFLKARLPIPVLEQIWNLVDQKESGQLTRPQFIVAMHLIQCFMNKSLSVLPTVLSDQLWKVAGGSSPSTSGHHPAPISPPPPRAHTQTLPISQHQQQPQQLQHANTSPIKQQLSGSVVASSTTNLNTWIMSNQQKQQYGAIFDTLDTKHQNFITSSTVANFLMTSKLPNQVLASIWELANLDQSDNFTKQEFSIAMYLVQKKLAGYELPEETPLELIQSSAFDDQQLSQPVLQQVPPPQSFASAKAMAAPQRTPSHMDDLLGIFQSVPPVPAAPASSQNIHHSQTLPPPAPVSRMSSNLTGSNFAPTSHFGKGLQKAVAEEEEDSSDDDEGPENLDVPRVRGAAPVIPGRSSKPIFSSDENVASNYDAIKSVNVNNDPSTLFSNQPANTAANSLGGFTNTAAAGVGAGVGAAVGFTGGVAASALHGGFSNSSSSNNKAVTDQITQASVDIANYSNQVSSLSKQTTIVSGKKDKAQNELNKILKKKEEIANKLSQLRALHEKETQQVTEVQNVMIKSKSESDELAKELAIVEANYHAEQTKKEQLQAEYDESQKKNQSFKEQLGTLNAENIDLKKQIEELSGKVKQANNMLAVTQQQVATQDSQNEELRQKVSELNNSIFQIDSRHKTLLSRIAELNDENLDLHEKQTDLSIQSANKNVEYSETLADAAAKGLVGEDFHETDDVNEEVPTASLDDFDDEEFTATGNVQAKEVQGVDQSKEVSTDKLTNSPGTTTSDNSMSKQTETTVPTETVSDNTTVVNGQQFSLPFGTAHSETSSTRNNPSQSERGDIDATTIEQTGPLSSQVLPEGTISESGDSASSQEKSESFEFINHPPVQTPSTPTQKKSNTQDSSLQSTDAKSITIAPATSMAAAIAAAGMTSPVRQASTSGQTSEVETLSDTPPNRSNQTPELDEFPPIQELKSLDDSDSSSDDDDNDNFQDADIVGDLQPVKIETPAEDSKNPFNKSATATTNGETEEPTAPANLSNNPQMFDDLGLEEAQVESTGDAFDSPALNDGNFSNIGFTYAGAEGVQSDKVPSIQPMATALSSATDGDDWEQVFAGFGNDPNLQPAVEEGNGTYDSHFPQPAVFGFSAVNEGNNNEHFSNGLDQTVQNDISKANDAIHLGFTEAEELAIEELSDMGFDKKDSIAALKLKNWNIDDASNYLLDKA